MSADKLIVISTHILEEVEALCSRAIIIADGKVLADDTPHALAMRSRYHNAVRLTVGSETSFDEVASSVAKLESVEATESDREHGDVTAIARSDSKDMQTWNEDINLVKDKQWNIERLQLEAGRLDEVFRQITKGAAA